MTNTTAEKVESLVSVVAVMEDQIEDIEPEIRALQQHLEQHFSDYEIVLVNQPADRSIAERMEGLLQQVPSIRFMELAFTVYPDVAMAAAVENAIGDFVVMFTPGVDPPDCIMDLVELCRDGADVVIGISRQPQSLGYRIVRPWNQWLLARIGYTIPRDATGLRCLSRRVVNAVTQTGRFHHQFFVRIANTGYPGADYHYSARLQHQDRKTLREGMRDAVRLLVFNSTRPLRWMSGLGFAGSFFAFLIALYSVLIRLLKDNVIEGWTSMVLFMSILFMLLFTILAFFGEYLGRLLDDSSERRDYSIAFELNSSVMLQEDRINVISESLGQQPGPVGEGR